MQAFDRTSEHAPACLSDDSSRAAREALRQLFTDDTRFVAQTRVSMRKFAVDAPELRAALRRLFRGRCAFCEMEVDTSPYRFRPTEEAGPAGNAPMEDGHRAHLYYSWLTNSWHNIYPICDECLPRETSLFPVRGQRMKLPIIEEIERYVTEPTGSWPGKIEEKPLLLDPCGNDQIQKHLATEPSGRLFHLSEKGKATIDQFNLNRERLRKRRSVMFRHYWSQLLNGDDLRNKMAFGTIEFEGCWFLLLKQIDREARGATYRRPALSRSNVGDYFNRRLDSPMYKERLTAAWANLETYAERASMQRQVSTREPSILGSARPTLFQIRNFKSIEEIDIRLPLASPRLDRNESVPLAASLLILGENAAGKSSILEAMAIALCSAATRDSFSSDVDKFILDPTQMGSDYAVGIRTSSVSVSYEDNTHNEVTLEPMGFFETHGAENERFAEHRIPVFAYGTNRLFLADDKPIRPADAVRSLLQPNYVLANPERWLLKISDKPVFDEVVRALRSILAIGQSFQTLEVDEGRRRCLLVIKTVSAGGSALLTKTPLSTVSSGFRSVLGMACDVIRRLISLQGRYSASLAKTRAVVIVDEIEAHLHPRWKMRIMQGLREALPNVTFIATTHDPLCLRSMDGSEVVVLRRALREQAGVGRLPMVVERVEDLPSIGTLTIEQILTSNLFQLFTTDDETIEANLEAVGALLASERAGQLDQSEGERLAAVRKRIREDITTALPIGSTEVQRLVQEAVELYLRERRQAVGERSDRLREDTRAAIVSALRGL